MEPLLSVRDFLEYTYLKFVNFEMHATNNPIAFDERVTSMLYRTRSLPCANAFVALFACALAEWLYATLHANKATYVHVQGSGRVRLNQKVTLSSKAIRLHMHSWVYLR